MKKQDIQKFIDQHGFTVDVEHSTGTNSTRITVHTDRGDIRISYRVFRGYFTAADLNLIDDYQSMNALVDHKLYTTMTGAYKALSKVNA